MTDKRFKCKGRRGNAKAHTAEGKWERGNDKGIDEGKMLKQEERNRTKGEGEMKKRK